MEAGLKKKQHPLFNENKNSVFYDTLNKVNKENVDAISDESTCLVKAIDNENPFDNENPYDNEKLKKICSDEETKKTFMREASRFVHPDKNPGCIKRANQRFDELQHLCGDEADDDNEIIMTTHEFSKFNLTELFTIASGLIYSLVEDPTEKEKIIQIISADKNLDEKLKDDLIGFIQTHTKEYETVLKTLGPKNDKFYTIVFLAVNLQDIVMTPAKTSGETKGGAKGGADVRRLVPFFFFFIYCIKSTTAFDPLSTSAFALYAAFLGIIGSLGVAVNNIYTTQKMIDSGINMANNVGVAFEKVFDYISRDPELAAAMQAKDLVNFDFKPTKNKYKELPWGNPYYLVEPGTPLSVAQKVAETIENSRKNAEILSKLDPTAMAKLTNIIEAENNIMGQLDPREENGIMNLYGREKVSANPELGMYCDTFTEAFIGSHYLKNVLEQCIDPNKQITLAQANLLIETITDIALQEEIDNSGRANAKRNKENRQLFLDLMMVLGGLFISAKTLRAIYDTIIEKDTDILSKKTSLSLLGLLIWNSQETYDQTTSQRRIDMEEATMKAKHNLELQKLQDSVTLTLNSIKAGIERQKLENSFKEFKILHTERENARIQTLRVDSFMNFSSILDDPDEVLNVLNRLIDPASSPEEDGAERTMPEADFNSGIETSALEELKNPFTSSEGHKLGEEKLDTIVNAFLDEVKAWMKLLTERISPKNREEFINYGEKTIKDIENILTQKRKTTPAEETDEAFTIRCKQQITILRNNFNIRKEKILLSSNVITMGNNINLYSKIAIALKQHHTQTPKATITKLQNTIKQFIEARKRYTEIAQNIKLFPPAHGEILASADRSLLMEYKNAAIAARNLCKKYTLEIIKKLPNEIINMKVESSKIENVNVKTEFQRHQEIYKKLSDDFFKHLTTIETMDVNSLTFFDQFSETDITSENVISFYSGMVMINEAENTGGGASSLTAGADEGADEGAAGAERAAVPEGAAGAERATVPEGAAGVNGAPAAAPTAPAGANGAPAAAPTDPKGAAVTERADAPKGAAIPLPSWSQWGEPPPREEDDLYTSIMHTGKKEEKKDGDAAGAAIPLPSWSQWGEPPPREKDDLYTSIMYTGGKKNRKTKKKSRKNKTKRKTKRGHKNKINTRKQRKSKKRR